MNSLDGVLAACDCGWVGVPTYENGKIVETCPACRKRDKSILIHDVNAGTFHFRPLCAVCRNYKHDGRPCYP